MANARIELKWGLALGLVVAGCGGDETADGGEAGVHMPSQSWMPMLAAGGFLFIGFGMPMMAMGVPHAGWLVIGGLGVLFLGIWLWALEGPGGYMLKTPAPAGRPAPAATVAR